MSNFKKIRPVGAEMFHVDSTNMTKLTVIFRNLGNALKNGGINPPILNRDTKSDMKSISRPSHFCAGDRAPRGTIYGTRNCVGPRAGPLALSGNRTVLR